MNKKMFSKTLKTNANIKFKKLNDEIYAYKISYKLLEENYENFGYCTIDEKEELIQKFIIPKKLTTYFYCHKNGLTKINLFKEYVIEPKEFFKQNELVPNPDDLIFIKPIPFTRKFNTPTNSIGDFLYEYGNDIPLPMAILIDNSSKKIKDPILSDKDYDLEKSLEILKNREDIRNDAFFNMSPYITDLSECPRIGLEIMNMQDYIEERKSFYQEAGLDFNKEIQKEIVLDKNQYISFVWYPNKEDWKKYFLKYKDTNLEIANEYLLNEILKLPKK